MTRSEVPAPSIVCDDDCLTLDQAADAGRWGSLSSLHHYRRQGRLSAHKLLGRVHLRHEDLDALLRPVPATADLDPVVIEWVKAVAATAPPLTPADAAQVAALLVGRGGAAA